ncbi:MAG: phospholipase D-like domain-containing protein [Methylococcus sp.]|nr:phospholipase D-like domain-containing protein [Methylococcus sp.]
MNAQTRSTLIFCLLALAAETPARSSQDIEVFVQPQDQQTKATVTRAIRAAKRSVDIVIYDLGAQDILTALQAAKTRLARNRPVSPAIRIMVNGQWLNAGATAIQATYWHAMMAPLGVDPATGRSADGVVQFNYAANNFQITHQKTLLIDARKADGSAYPHATELPFGAKAIVATFNLQAYGWPQTWSGSTPGANCPNNPQCSFAANTRDFGVVLRNRDQIFTIERVFSSDFQGPSPTESNIALGLNDPAGTLVWSNGTLGIAAPPPDGFGDVIAFATDAYPAFQGENAGSGFYPYPYGAFIADALAAPGQVRPGTVAGNAKAALLNLIGAAAKAAGTGIAAKLYIYNEEYADTDILAAINAAAAAGVQIRVLMTFNAGNGPAYQQLVTTTRPDGSPVDAVVHLYPDTSGYIYLHAKMVYLDLPGGRGDQVVLGSQNFSPTSLEQNRELGVRLSAAKGSLSRPASAKLLSTFRRDFSYLGTDVPDCPVVVISPTNTWNAQIAGLNTTTGCPAPSSAVRREDTPSLSTAAETTYFPAPLSGVQNSYQPPLPQGPITGFTPPACVLVGIDGSRSVCYGD